MSRVSLQQDPCSYEEKLSRSIGPGMYMLNTPANDIDECGRDIPADPSLRWQSWGPGFCAPGKTIDTGSELLGLNYKNTKCAAEQYDPATYVHKGGICQAVGNQDPRKCGTPQEASRLSNPPCTLRATGWNRWEWLCYDPQERATVPFDHLVSNRIMVKDNHVPLLHTPQEHTNELNAPFSEDPSQTLSKWSPPAGIGAEPPGNNNSAQIYRSTEWCKSVGN
jgi:hypothetical protein